MEPENEPPEKGDSYWKPSFSGSMLVCGGERVLNPKRRFCPGRICVFPFWNGNPRILGGPISFPVIFGGVLFQNSNRLLFPGKFPAKPRAGGLRLQFDIIQPQEPIHPVFSHRRFTEDRFINPPKKKRNEWMNGPSPFKRGPGLKRKIHLQQLSIFRGYGTVTFRDCVYIYTYIVDYCGMRAKVNGSPINYNIQW